MTRPATIEGFLERFERALRLSGRRRRRVVDEARDHLLEARDRGIAEGLDPRAAEVAAIEAFGDPAAVASRFDPDLRARLAGELDRYDRWRAVHPVAGITVVLAPMAGVVAVTWSPFLALSALPAWAVFAWMGEQLKDRPEPGYRHRLWGWRRERPAAYQIATNASGVLGVAACFALDFLAGSPNPTPWLFVMLAPLFPLSWLLNAPRRYRPPATPAD